MKRLRTTQGVLEILALLENIEEKHGSFFNPVRDFIQNFIYFISFVISEHRHCPWSFLLAPLQLYPVLNV